MSDPKWTVEIKCTTGDKWHRRNAWRNELKLDDPRCGTVFDAMGAARWFIATHTRPTNFEVVVSVSPPGTQAVSVTFGNAVQFTQESTADRLIEALIDTTYSQYYHRHITLSCSFHRGTLCRPEPRSECVSYSTKHTEGNITKVTNTCIVSNVSGIIQQLDLLPADIATIIRDNLRPSEETKDEFPYRGGDECLVMRVRASTSAQHPSVDTYTNCITIQGAVSQCTDRPSVCTTVYFGELGGMDILNTPQIANTIAQQFA